MNATKLRRTLLSLALAGVTVMSANALADPPQGGYGPGYGMGPGMMGGYGPQGGYGPGGGGPGAGGYGPGYGMGPGMMGGYGPGYGMGPGMMGGYGPGYGMGPGMMGGYGPGYGMGPGMMGGYGPGYGMGPGMMGGYGPGYGMLGQLNLTPEQWSKISGIHQDFGKKQWDLAGKMQQEAFKLRELMTADKRDRNAINEQYKKLQDIRQQRFQARLDAQEKVDSVLTTEQKDQLRQFGPRW